MHHRIFIAFAIEDRWARDRLVGQARNQRTPFEWTDMSVKEPWSSDWKNRCRTRIRGCDGMIAFVTQNTANASGQLFEIRTAREEDVPLMGMYATQDNRPFVLPPELYGLSIVEWTWDNISNFLNRL
ncbi:TIR domain-containing protein [Sphingobium sp. B11D3A]|uniref:TIR domain-containing protein n=1 Tax=Sphingobium sp. B11D3A TaxID=2940574 RepID=UPI0039B43A91